MLAVSTQLRLIERVSSVSQDGKVYEGPAKPKADVTISLSDETFQSVSCS